MPFRVVLDASVVLAACLDPQMDAKAAVAANALDVLRDEGVRPAITETLAAEVDRKIHDRVGQILDALRTLRADPPPLPIGSGPTAMELLEPSFAKLRRMAEESAGALQILESRLAGSLADTPVTAADQWDLLLMRLAIEATELHAEIQRRRDTLGLELLTRAGKADRERFRDLVPTSDLDHVAVLAAIAEARGLDLLFVTQDSALHARRDDIGRAAPSLTVTTPTYLRRQIARLRAKD